MTLKKGLKVNRGYSTVIEDDGVNYREIADTMSEIGFVMNHSSARNYVLRVMRKFAIAICEQRKIKTSEMAINEIAKSPSFQQGIADLLHIVEDQRK
jgi:hypothetical protein